MQKHGALKNIQKSACTGNTPYHHFPRQARKQTHPCQPLFFAKFTSSAVFVLPVGPLRGSSEYGPHSLFPFNPERESLFVRGIAWPATSDRFIHQRPGRPRDRPAPSPLQKRTLELHRLARAVSADFSNEGVALIQTYTGA